MRFVQQAASSNLLICNKLSNHTKWMSETAEKKNAINFVAIINFYDFYCEGQ